MKQLLEKCDGLFLQETLLTQSDANELDQLTEIFLHILVPRIAMYVSISLTLIIWRFVASYSHLTEKILHTENLFVYFTKFGLSQRNNYVI